MYVDSAKYEIKEEGGKGGGSESRITEKSLWISSFTLKNRAFSRFPEKDAIVRYKERYSRQRRYVKDNTGLKLKKKDTFDPRGK